MINTTAITWMQQTLIIRKKRNKQNCNQMITCNINEWGLWIIKFSLLLFTVTVLQKWMITVNLSISISQQQLNSNTHSYDNQIINYQVPLKFHKFKNMIGHFSNFKDKNLNSSLLWPKFLLSWGLILLICYSLPRNKCILNCYSLLGYSTFLLKKTNPKLLPPFDK